MSKVKGPRPYPSWRKKKGDRAEDAANVFGYYLIRHCRSEALAKVPRSSSRETKRAAKEAVDLALHNVMDLLEGFWPTPAGRKHYASFALHVDIYDRKEKLKESVAISPCMLDLPIGYWGWRDGEF